MDDYVFWTNATIVSVTFENVTIVDPVLVSTKSPWKELSEFVTAQSAGEKAGTYVREAGANVWSKLP
jgi:hypothetical protein